MYKKELKTTRNDIFDMLNLQSLHTNCRLQIHIEDVDQHAEGKWFIQCTKHRKENRLPGLELPSRVSDKILYGEVSYLGDGSLKLNRYRMPKYVVQNDEQWKWT